MQRTVLKKARPNGWYVELVEYRYQSGDVFYEVQEQGYEHEAETLTHAQAIFDERVRELELEPNWERQAEYDDLHGTVNGYSPWQYEREY